MFRNPLYLLIPLCNNNLQGAKFNIAMLSPCLLILPLMASHMLQQARFVNFQSFKSLLEYVTSIVAIFFLAFYLSHLLQEMLTLILFSAYTFSMVLSKDIKLLQLDKASKWGPHAITGGALCNRLKVYFIIWEKTVIYLVHYETQKFEKFNKLIPWFTPTEGILLIMWNLRLVVNWC